MHRLCSTIHLQIKNATSSSCSRRTPVSNVLNLFLSIPKEQTTGSRVADALSPIPQVLGWTQFPVWNLSSWHALIRKKRSRQNVWMNLNIANKNIFNVTTCPPSYFEKKFQLDSFVDSTIYENSRVTNIRINYFSVCSGNCKQYNAF